MPTFFITLGRISNTNFHLIFNTGKGKKRKGGKKERKTTKSITDLRELKHRYVQTLFLQMKRKVLTKYINNKNQNQKAQFEAVISLKHNQLLVSLLNFLLNKDALRRI